mmetsp:Transcript_71208/g.170538  ORF Transcript_71208/g.170538 Transcript_71208/m.170538 type:complete len:91 (+) Transcript_71208:801-1073(+)
MHSPLAPLPLSTTLGLQQSVKEERAEPAEAAPLSTTLKLKHLRPQTEEKEPGQYCGYHPLSRDGFGTSADAYGKSSPPSCVSRKSQRTSA